ncbi:MAG: holo-ACP synthase [Alphaproteobacteria bacterium]|nr:holo-ACP synthase [Alphaproteobacteria bacterium]
MIIGIGSDIVDIRRISRLLLRYNQVFITKLFTNAERCAASSQFSEAAHYAKRFAAKEALVKALGVGFRKGIRWRDIEVRNDAFGKPHIYVYGMAEQRLKLLANGQNTSESKHPRLHLSLSDEYPYAQAMVVLEI